MLLILTSLASLMLGILSIVWLTYIIAHAFGVPFQLSQRIMMLVGIPLTFALPLLSVISGVVAIRWVLRLGNGFHPLSFEGGQVYAFLGVCLGGLALAVGMVGLLCLLALPH